MADRRPLALPRPCVVFFLGHYRGGGPQHDAQASGQSGKDGNHSLARRASEGTVEDQIVYVAMLADGSQRTYTPAEFAKTFNWKNDPEKAELLGK